MNLLKSLFTEHLATKFMALVLAVVLFLFVQQTIEGKDTIDTIRLEFKLATSEREKYTLETREVELTGVEVKGTKKDVNLLVEQLEQNPTQTIEIDSRFLALEGSATEMNIKINEQFLHDHKVIPEDISVMKLPGDQRLKIHKNDVFLMRLELGPGMNERTVLETDPSKRKHVYEGTLEGGGRVDLSFNMPGQLRVRAPRICFIDGRARPTLLVTIGFVDKFLEDQFAQGVSREEIHMPVEGFDLRASAIRQNFLDYAYFWVGDRWQPCKEFLNQLEALFVVLQQSKYLERDLDVRCLTHQGRTLKWLLGNYDKEGAVGGIDFDFDPDTQTVSQFDLQMPQGFPESYLDTLVLVLDIANAKISGDKIDIPLLLDVKDRRKEDILAKVQIRLAENEVRAYARYRKK